MSEMNLDVNLAVWNTHRQMFDLPNKKAMEVVMHYLFCKLNEALCHDQFR